MDARALVGILALLNEASLLDDDEEDDYDVEWS